MQANPTYMVQRTINPPPFRCPTTIFCLVERPQAGEPIYGGQFRETEASFDYMDMPTKTKAWEPIDERTLTSQPFHGQKSSCSKDLFVIIG